MQYLYRAFSIAEAKLDVNSYSLDVKSYSFDRLVVG